MTRMVLKERAFIGGYLRYPGEEVETDETQPDGFAIPGSTPVGNLTTEQIELLLARRRLAEAGVSDLRDAPRTPAAAEPANDRNTGSAPMEIADITARSPGTNRPQGVPPGGTPVGNGQFVFEAPREAPFAIEEPVAPGGEAVGVHGIAPLSTEELQARSAPPAPAGEAGEYDPAGVGQGDEPPADYNSSTKAQLQTELQNRGITYESDANKARLIELLQQDDAGANG